MGGLGLAPVRDRERPRYAFGDETILGLSLTRTLRAVYSRATVGASLQVKAHFRGRSTYLHAPVPSTGSRMVILSPGLRITTPGGLGFYAYLQVPVYRNVNDEQLGDALGAPDGRVEGVLAGKSVRPPDGRLVAA